MTAVLNVNRMMNPKNGHGPAHTSPILFVCYT